MVRTLTAMAGPKTTRPPDSALAAALARVGDRWTLLLVQALQPGPRRFSDLQADLPGLAPNILSQRLKRLTADGVALARPYSDRPPRAVYELTARGRELGGVLGLLADWAARSADGVEAPRHDACGTPMRARWYCPTCARLVDDDEGETLRFL